MDTVLVTGTSRGIGKALKTAFEAQGDCVIGYRRDEMGDIRDPDTIEKIKNLAQEAKINILVNNIGVYSENWIYEESPEKIKEIIEVNLIAPILITSALWPILTACHGTIININSIAGRESASGEIAYRASKFGLTGFSRALFYEGMEDEVRIIDIPFSGVNTDMIKGRPKNHNALQQPGEAADLIIRILKSENPASIEHILVKGSQIIDNKRATIEKKAEEERKRARRKRRIRMGV